MIIEPGRYLFSKIECRDYDVLLPFSCRKTGRCCSVYVSRIPYDHLEILTALGGLPPEMEHCALLAANTLKAACEDYLKNQKGD